MVIRRGSAAILLMSAGAVLSGCALPFAGPLVFTDILTGASLLSTVATGKGATEIALDALTGEDCRLLEGALREDRDFCEQPGSAATEEDFKGVVAWLEEDEPDSPVPGDTDTPHIMVADIGLPGSSPTLPVVQFLDSITVPATASLQPSIVALASISELPNEWIVLASLQTGSDFTELGAIAPASGTPDLIRAKLDSSPLPFLQTTASPEADLADWALDKMHTGTPSVAEQALTIPPSRAQGHTEALIQREVYWNNLSPAGDIENLPTRRYAAWRGALNETLVRRNSEPSLDDALLLPVPAKPVLQALLLPAPAKPQLQAVLPHPQKPLLRAELPDDSKRANADFDVSRPTQI